MRSAKHFDLDLDDFAWLLIAIQSSALMALWMRLFSQFPFFVIYIVVVLLIGWIRRLFSKALEDLDDGRGLRLVVIFLLSILLTLYTVFADVPKAGDAISYHLPMAAQWIQSGSIFSQDSRVWFYPGGYEVLSAVFFLITSNDTLWFVPDIFSLILFSFSAYQMLTILGVNSPSAGLFVIALILSSVISRTLGAGDNDLWVAALTVTSVGSFLRSVIKSSRESWSLGVVCLGALACSKYSAFPLILILFLYCTVFRYFSFCRARSQEIASIALALFLALSFPLRNFLITGNPLYPTGIGGFFPWGDTSQLVSILNRITPTELASTALVGRKPDVWRLFFSKLFEQATILPILASLAVAASVARVSYLRIDRKELFLLATAAFASALFVTQPLVVENIPGTLNQLSEGWSLRFALPSIALLSLFFITRIPKAAHPYTAFLLVALSIFRGNAWAALLLAIASLSVVAALKSRFRLNLACMVALIPFILTLFAVKRNVDRPAQAYNQYTYGGRTEVSRIFQRSQCSHVIILSTALRSYPLIGFDFKNRVVSVGMSLPAEYFAESAALNDADIVIASVENGDEDSLTFGQFPPGTDRILPLLGPGWQILYEDGFVVTHIKTNRASKCFKSLPNKILKN